MVGDAYSRCPMCDGEDGQGCYSDCPSVAIAELTTVNRTLGATVRKLMDDLKDADAEIARLRKLIAFIGDYGDDWHGGELYYVGYAHGGEKQGNWCFVHWYAPTFLEAVEAAYAEMEKHKQENQSHDET